MFDQILFNVRTVLGNTNSIDLGIAATLDEIVASFDLGWAAYWKLNLKKNVFYLHKVWPGTKALELMSDALSREFAMNQGTIGKVWKMDRSMVSMDTYKDMMLPRSVYANNLHLEYGAWFPVHVRGSTQGVLELLSTHGFSKEGLSALDDLCTLFENFLESKENQ